MRITKRHHLHIYLYLQILNKIFIFQTIRLLTRLNRQLIWVALKILLYNTTTVTR